MRKSEAAQILQSSRNTIDLWLEQQAETGDYQATANRFHCTVNKIANWQKFTKFAQRYDDCT